MAKIEKEIEILKTKLLNGNYSKEDIYKIMRAAGFGKIWHDKQKRANGEPYFIHPIQVASILIDLDLDVETIMAALLHDTVEDTDITLEFLEQQFGKEVAVLVDGVTKISIIKAKNKSNQEIETIRKMVIAMTKDIRVIFIKLADKVHNMRTLKYLKPERQKILSQECLDIYAPLAGQLGISEIKQELEDLSLKYLQPEIYKKIKQYVSLKKRKINAYLDIQKEEIIKAAKEEGIDIKVETRAKHFYSIYQKMKRYDKEVNEIYDLIGLRIFCQTANECYALLGAVHKIWKPVENRLKDYIAIPKPNGYQSLHTTVTAGEGKILEVQIRTYSMHMTAEYGIAAHWLYKHGRFAGSFKPRDIALINRLKHWNRFNVDKSYFLDDLKEDILKDTIFVFTPEGDVIELPARSTAIDFAYYIHSEIGNHCKAAKADGMIIPLGKELMNSQCVEIITSNSAHPHLHWLRVVKTSRAKSKIRAWLNKNDSSLLISKNVVITEKQTLPAPKTTGKIPEVQLPDEIKNIVKGVIDKDRVALRVGGEKNMMITFAKCCSPVLGDDIIGYVSVGRGIIVHKSDCPNLKNINEINLRKISVEWETVSSKPTKRYKVSSKTTQDIFSEIESAIKKYKGHIIDGQIFNETEDKINGYFTIEIEKKEDFKKAIKSARAIPSILNIMEI